MALKFWTLSVMPEVCNEDCLYHILEQETLACVGDSMAGSSACCYRCVISLKKCEVLLSVLLQLIALNVRKIL